MLGQIQPAVQGGQKRGWLPGEQREWKVVEMEVQKIELFIVALLPDAFQHHHVQRIRIADRSVETQSLGPSRIELRRSPGIAAGEQRHVVPQRYQLLG